MGCKNSEWPPEETEMLRGCIAGRLSSGATAATLSRAFDRVVTRNAVISKARALRLMFDSVSAHNSKERKREIAAGKRNDPPRKPVRPAPIVVEPDELVEPEDIAIPVSGRVTIIGLRNSTCRFPVERIDDQWMFCGLHGADLAAGRPYCAEHTKVATLRVWTPEEREFNKQRIALMQAAKKTKAREA